MTAPRALTLEQRAERRARRKNNHTARTYPLLAGAGLIDDWMLTTQEAEEQIEQFGRKAAAWAEQRARNREQALQLAAELRAKVAGQVDAQTLDLLDKHLATTYPPGYEVSFWRRVLDGKFDIHLWLADIEHLRRLGKQRPKESVNAA